MIAKISEARDGIESMFHISTTDTLESVTFASFHSIMKHGTIFWGNSSNSKKIFILQ
jgi:hypothetical protein